MAWLIDGSNVLGALRLDRQSVDAKRDLARLCAAFARAKRTRVTCYFDGNEPPAFARHLGNTTIVFSGARTADELIVQRVEESASQMTVVTADRELQSRVARRRVRTVTAQEFVHELRAFRVHKKWAARIGRLTFPIPKTGKNFDVGAPTSNPSALNSNHLRSGFLSGGALLGSSSGVARRIAAIAEESPNSHGQQAGQHPGAATRRKVQQRIDRRSSKGASRRKEARVKRCGKSAPRTARAAPAR